MKGQFNLFYPEWQGYGGHQDVYHGAHHFRNHVGQLLKYKDVDVPKSEVLKKEGGIIGRSAFLRMMDQATSIIQSTNPEKTFMMGGTCASEIAPIAYLNEKYDGDLAVFWFDAHGDLNTPESSPSARMHGMPLRSLLGEGDELVLQRISKKLKPEQVALIGARDLDAGEKVYISENRIPDFIPSGRSHLDELIDFAKSAGFNNAYIHFDLDGLDPIEFPHVLMPVENGLSVQNAIVGISRVRQFFNVVGCSIVEYCPKNGGGTEQLGQIVTDGLGIEM